MKESNILIGDINVPLISVHTLVIGSGVAALNAAVHLDVSGIEDLLIVTNNLGGGTSNNTGSDKQTYYKLSIAGESLDSPYQMAQDYFEGGGMHGDLALIESALSAREFFHLVQLGVDFPFNRYGEYGGYKTDHDPKGRGTSAGPWTSQQMFSSLYEEVKKRDIEVRDKVEIVGLLTTGKGNEKRVIGAVGIDKDNINPETAGLVVFRSENIIFGVGGPGGLYKDSVYPESQIGSIGLALEIGAIGDSLPESQFGIASTSFRWSLSGTYQQVIPTYFSTDQQGRDRKEFLNRYFPSMKRLATAIFLKGYQWPFNANHVENFGSSLIDLLVYLETKVKGRRVFLDYTKNPSGDGLLNDFTPEILDGEAKEYLKNSDALFGNPIERLETMNPQAIELYKRHGIDLANEPLEISVCAQHNNGGLKGNIWWESNIKHLFPVGEVNGSHGVQRPGGSALNSGQVGSLRAAQYINAKYDKWEIEKSDFEKSAKPQIQKKLDLALEIIGRTSNKESKWEVRKTREQIQARMSKYGAHIRKLSSVQTGVKEAEEMANQIKRKICLSSPAQLPKAFQNLHLLTTQLFYLKAIEWYIKEGGGSRGSYLIIDKTGKPTLDKLGEEWKFREENIKHRDRVQETYLDNNAKIQNRWVQRRPLPQEKFWFETAWRDYREGKIFE